MATTPPQQSISLTDKIKNIFKLRLNTTIIILSIIIFAAVFGFSLFSLYKLIYPSKIEAMPIKKFEINQNLYKEVSEKIDKKEKLDEKAIKEKIDPIQDPFEKK